MTNEQVENVMAIAFELARIREEHGAQSGMYLSEVRALRAEVERLAAQAAPTLLDAFKSGNAILIDWPMEPVTPQESLKLMDMMDAEYAKTIGKPAPDREMAICMQRVQHMACDLWASQKEVIRAHFVELAAAQAPVVQAGDMRSYLDFVLEPRHINGEVSAVEYEQALIELRLLRDRASSGAAQAVRMLTREELNDVALSEQVGWGPGEYVEAVQRKFCAVNAGLTIPADGVIGGV